MFPALLAGSLVMPLLQWLSRDGGHPPRGPMHYEEPKTVLNAGLNTETVLVAAVFLLVLALMVMLFITLGVAYLQVDLARKVVDLERRLGRASGTRSQGSFAALTYQQGQLWRGGCIPGSTALPSPLAGAPTSLRAAPPRDQPRRLPTYQP